MTIARRLIILVAVPLLVLIGLGIFNRVQMARIETSSRFVAETQITSLATLGNISRSFAELRLDLRGYLVGDDKARRASSRAAFDADKAVIIQLLQKYADNLVAGDKDRRMLDEYTGMIGQWIADAEKIMALADEGHRDEAGVLLMGPHAQLGDRLGKVSSEWVKYNELLAMSTGAATVQSIESSGWRMLAAFSFALALSGLLGWLTFRRIVLPIRALQTSVESIAQGDYAKDVPFRAAADETGALARSVEVLKQGAAAMDGQRWVKTNAAKLTGELQSAASLTEFGDRLLSGLVPLLGGGVAGFYAAEAGLDRLRRTAGFGLAENSGVEDFIHLGQGLVGQCARDRTRVSLAGLPPDYLRITSGLGGAVPVQAAAWPLVSQGALFGVFEFASFRPLKSSENALLEELLPVAAMSLEILQRNIKTHELLEWTQEQAEELKAQQESILEAEERTRLILDSTDEGIFGVDTQGIISFVNPAACHLLGFSADEMVGQSPHALFHHHRPDGSEFPLGECAMYAAYKLGKASRIDDEVLWRKDGASFPVDYGATPILKDGTLLGSVISFTDITERKRMEQEVRHQNFLSDGALELTKAGYWHVPLDGSGWYISSERAARIFGDLPSPGHRYRLDEWAEHVREGDEAAAKITAENFSAAVAGTVPVYDATYAYKRPVDGRRVWIHALGQVVKDESGKPRDMYGVTQDITDFKRLEDELRLAMQKAEEATQMKSMFLANMSHEIRTPMNAIIGLSHLALKTDMSPKQRDYVSKVHGAGTSLLTVINDILDFSKIEAGRLDIESTTFKLDEVIQSVAVVTGQKAHDKGLEFLMEVPAEIPQNLVGDPLRLGQILTNLINNAVKFTERGEIRVKAELQERTGEKAKMQFSVLDTGMGMTKEQAARLFQPFTQADMSTTRKHGGTGLGLTISKRLVELMGGQIWLESEPGQGSTFIFTVWLGLGSAVAKVVPEQLGCLSVLVVDDNSAARDILVDALRAVTAQVDAVSSGPEAVSAVRERATSSPYDVVFMDWRMPGMDGLQAARLIKLDQKVKKQPAIVMVTAFGREEVREEAEKLAIDDFLVKPVTKSMLVDALVNIFAPAQKETAKVSRKAGEDGVRLDGVRILLAEDNDINQQIAVELLRGVGAEVVVANNGREAWETLDRAQDPSPCDLVLMDVQMPEMDGYQATAKIRSDKRFETLPVIAMTAHATVEERQRCFDAGMDDHVAKPIDPNALYATLARHVRGGAKGSSKPRPAGRSGEPAPAAPAPVIPPAEGLDAADGLRRVGGNAKLYRSLLKQFIEGQSEAAERILESLQSGDRKTAERLAHTVKGVAGNIGAKAVQAAAAALEKALRSDGGALRLESMRNKLGGELAGLRAAVSALLGTEEEERPQATSTPADPARLQSAVERLSSLLCDSDAAAIDLLELEAAALRALFDAQGFARFETLVTSYAFDDALEALRGALRDKGE
jgi:PAS domain S-box-containing protein